MARKYEIKNFLKESGYTEADIDQFWAELIETNQKVKMLHNSGIDWRDMNIAVIKNIPTQKQRDLEERKKIEQEEKQKEAERIEKERIKKYKKEHFEDYILEKIDNGIDLTEKEIREVLAYEIDCEEGENGRWTRSMYSVVKLKDRLFGIYWEEGLTEFQENEYMYQPEEVVKKEEEKVVKVVRYEKNK